VAQVSSSGDRRLIAICCSPTSFVDGITPGYRTAQASFLSPLDHPPLILTPWVFGPLPALMTYSRRSTLFLRKNQPPPRSEDGRPGPRVAGTKLTLAGRNLRILNVPARFFEKGIDTGKNAALVSCRLQGYPPPALVTSGSWTRRGPATPWEMVTRGSKQSHSWEKTERIKNREGKEGNHHYRWQALPPGPVPSLT
jgi:hypothetical protein